MWPTRRGQLILAALAFCAVFAMAGGCQSPQEEFLEDIREGLVIAGDSRIGGLSAGAVRLWLEDAERQDFDLFAMYADNLGDKPLRLALAYLLVLQESDPYVDFAEQHGADLLETREFLLWAWVLNQRDAGLSPAYRGRLLAVLVPGTRDAPFEPYVRLAVAEDHLARGEHEAAANQMLDLACEPTPWSWVAYMALTEAARNMPVSRSGEVLLPVLGSRSRRGTYAAAALACVEAHRPAAIEYLESLKASGDPDLVAAAEDAFAMIAQQDKEAELR